MKGFKDLFEWAFILLVVPQILIWLCSNGN